MDLDEIKRILDLMRENDLAEFELEQEGVKVRLRKNSAPQWNSQASVVPAAAYAPPPACCDIGERRRTGLFSVDGGKRRR